MAKRKIIFFCIVGIILVLLIFGLMILNKEKADPNIPKKLVIWINEGTSESYTPIIEGFKKYASEYKNTQIVIEKKSENPDKYRTMFLSALANEEGPDIFMLRHAEDDLLESKVAGVSGDIFDIADFQKRFDADIFSSLIVPGEKKGKGANELLLGVPLGYETLGIFYNRALMRTGVPEQWAGMQALYKSFPHELYPTNLGLGPTQVPNSVDILTFFLASDAIENYDQLNNATTTAFQEYYDYGDIPVGTEQVDQDEENDTTIDTLRSQVPELENKKITTVDLFLQGKIGTIVGYPSFIQELEKAQKRAAGESVEKVILTINIPQISRKQTVNVARYSYFGISQNSKNALASAKFLSYLATSDAQALALKIYPFLIPAQTQFLPGRQGEAISSIFPNAKLDAFLPKTGEKIVVFQYGMKSKFQDILSSSFRNTLTQREISGLSSTIAQEVACELFPDKPNISRQCEKE